MLVLSPSMEFMLSKKKCYPPLGTGIVEGFKTCST